MALTPTSTMFTTFTMITMATVTSSSESLDVSLSKSEFDSIGSFNSQ
ncbi:12733_t:CDS:2, partial [Dentiscutata heterogama]